MTTNQPPLPPQVPPASPRPKRKRLPPTSAVRQTTRHSRPTDRRGYRNTHGRRHLPIRKEMSAGGVAVRREGDNHYVALLKTEHKRGLVWVLPKGHVELHTGERVSEAAKREVEEEAGIKDLSVKDQLGVTRFKFQVEDAVVYKTVHYFLMMTTQKQLTPQAEEGLLEAAWFTFDEAITALEYDTDQDIVARARQRLTGQAPANKPRRPLGTSAEARRPLGTSAEARRPRHPSDIKRPPRRRQLRIHT